MIRTAPIWITLLMLGSLHGQAMVETGLLNGTAAGNAGPMGDAGKALRNLLNGSLGSLPAPGTSAVGPAGLNLPPMDPALEKILNGGIKPVDLSKIMGAGFNASGGFKTNGGSNTDPMQQIIQMMQQQSGPSGGDASVTRVPPEKMATPKNDGRSYEDPRLIQPGLEYDELVARFGPPAMEMTTEPGHRSLMYAGIYGTSFVEVQDGKVAAPEAPKPKAKPVESPRQFVVMNVK